MLVFGTDNGVRGVRHPEAEHGKMDGATVVSTREREENTAESALGAHAHCLLPPQKQLPMRHRQARTGANPSARARECA
eukprot:CAMPEP_0206182050 /NCGR_PEP_ID=MMETSP1474-20131121/69227_1 /ASSEMBLY_ACC=CAM_ASM_001110 /TAXON_ID=97495 /ORGANISM="Imantonia sp., Strain RCC918" /LENGTH=78 /DNA_ID=CAMNT_0053596537 /DNA_START=239 /DNA_END=475 /DNA_ORIENTATION=-